MRLIGIADGGGGGQRMRLDDFWTKDFWLFVAKAMVVLLFAVSPRTLIGPSNLLSREQESKRPKTPKHILRADRLQVSRSDRATRGPGSRSARAEILQCPSEGALLGVRPASEMPLRAAAELSKPGYLRPYDGAPPESHSSLPG
jgi:hypothetical protein